MGIEARLAQRETKELRVPKEILAHQEHMDIRDLRVHRVCQDRMEFRVMMVREVCKAIKGSKDSKACAELMGEMD